MGDERMRDGQKGVGNRLYIRWEIHETSPTPRKLPKRSITRATLLIHASRGRRRNRPKKIKLSPNKVLPLRLRKLPSQNKNRTRQNWKTRLPFLRSSRNWSSTRAATSKSSLNSA